MKDDELGRILKQFNLKVTPVRVKVLSILVGSDIALSHSDITDALGDDTIDKVTLYRTLGAFHEKGLIHKVANEDRNWQYAIMLEQNRVPVSEHEHAHFVCDTCERIFCFPITPSYTSNYSTVKQGFLIKGQEVRLHGLCPSCN